MAEGCQLEDQQAAIFAFFYLYSRLQERIRRIRPGFDIKVLQPPPSPGSFLTFKAQLDQKLYIHRKFIKLGVIVNYPSLKGGVLIPVMLD
jgi:hypothetical protein